MSNDKVELRFWKLHSRVGELVREGKRDAKAVADVLQIIQDKEAFCERFFTAQPKAATAVSLGTAEEQLARLRPLYQELFGFTFNPAEIKVPEAPPGFNRLIVGNETDLRPNRIVLGLQKKMRVDSYGVDLDKETIRASYIKRPKGTYAVWVRESEEPDDDMKGRSASDLERDGVNCLTFEERLLYEGVYFTETNSNLDVHNWTLCGGSRHSVGVVPCVGWHFGNGGVSVDWADHECRRGVLRARLAAS